MGLHLIAFAGTGIDGTLRQGVNVFALQLFDTDLPVATVAVNVWLTGSSADSIARDAHKFLNVPPGHRLCFPL